MPQLFKVVYIFSKNLQDHSLPFNLKNASIRLILNLVDEIFRADDPEDRGRQLLVRILSTFVDKVCDLSYIL